MIALTCQNLAVDVGRTRLLSDLSVSFDANSFHGIIGPNGAGKSTLLKALLGLIPAAEGDIRVGRLDGVGQAGRAGRAVSPSRAEKTERTVDLGCDESAGQGVRGRVDVGEAARGRTGAGEDWLASVKKMNAKQRARRMAYVPQAMETLPEITGEQFVRLSRFAGDKTRDDELVSYALEITGAGEWAERPLRATSGGQRQLTALARAIAQDADILLLDEPTSALDLAHEQKVLELLSEWMRGGNGRPRTVITVIHDLSTAARYCDQVAVLANGGLRAQGPPDEVLTAELISSTYGVSVDVREHPVTGTLTVTPLGFEND